MDVGKQCENLHISGLVNIYMAGATKELKKKVFFSRVSISNKHSYSIQQLNCNSDLYLKGKPGFEFD